MIYSNYRSLVQLEKWYETPLGLRFAQAIKTSLMPHIACIKGKYLLQLGVEAQQDWLDKSPIVNKYVLSPSTKKKNGVICVPDDALPIATESIDLVFLPLVLEFIQSPLALLSEIDRILAPNGVLIIAGINSFSLWGFRRLLKLGQIVPWNGKFLNVIKLEQMLIRQDFEIQSEETFFYRPPFNNDYFLEKSYFLEVMGRLTWIYPGALYLIVARKQEIKMMPIKPIWKLGDYVLGKQDVPAT